MNKKQNFADSLVEAQGRSEFVVVVVADIRGFSRFSTINESPNIAMFIKRFYLQLINQYFKTANFIKPTGDGLLMTFAYDEKNLADVCARIIEACMSCLNDFPTICKDDPMINFDVPESIGFGIARGTACCLYSGDEVLDYSGHLLNLASRLNDLARPSGIVIDGGFLLELIPDNFRTLFKEQQVFVRSIAEEKAINVFYLDRFVEIPDSALSPLTAENWESMNLTFTARQFLNAASGFLVKLQKPVDSASRIKITLLVSRSGKGVKKGTKMVRNFRDFRFLSDGPEQSVRLDLAKAKTHIPPGNTKPVTFKIDYIPKRLPRT